MIMTMTMTTPVDAVWQAPVQQHLFRALVEAFARPGTLQSTGALAHGQPAWLAVLATLLDAQTTFADPHALLDGRTWSLLQTRRESPESAAFVACDGARLPDFEPLLGTLESPERGATLLLRVTDLAQGEMLTLSGPGVAGTRALPVAGLHPAWLERRALWVGAFPLGVDWILADESGFVALPRTTRIAGYEDSHRWAM
jgi:alpha-D-ribose 1-methylphosphonate 5-triphosphate synthase subunit PhnH